MLPLLSREEAEERIARVLKAAGVEALLTGCSCCGTFRVTFPDGAKCDYDELYIDTADVTLG